MKQNTCFPLVSDLPEISTDQMIEVDRLMIEDVGISLIQMMENAGRSLAVVAREVFLGGDVSGKHVAVFAGPGGNGGGAITAARRLAIWGAQLSLYLSHESDAMTPVPQSQLDILRHVRGDVHLPNAAITADLIIDGLIGYSLHGTPRGNAADAITKINASGSPVLALDVPSGFDGRSGMTSDIVVKADATLTLAWPKTGLLAPTNRETVGDVYCADISVPQAVLHQVGITERGSEIFAQSDIVRLT